jgi:hypothetical protein
MEDKSKDGFDDRRQQGGATMLDGLRRCPAHAVLLGARCAYDEGET